MMSKQYGLIVPNKNTKSGAFTKPSIFDEDSDDDGASARPTGITKNLKRQDKVVQAKAIEEDPTVYQYDELYDEMDQKRKESKLSRKDLDRKPKYINKLLLAADRRKRENERRIEKQVQKEREAEGEAFKDKESFVTSAYRKKLEELKELEAQELREEYLESIGDVKKQQNLDGFYRHLYDQKVNYEERVKKENEDADTGESESESNQSGGAKKVDVDDTDKKTHKRKYRRHESDSDKSDDEPEIKKEHLPSNLDADSDFSIDSSDSEDESKPADNGEDTKSDDRKKNEATIATTEAVANKTDDKTKAVVSVDDKLVKDENVQETKPPKPKIDIWKKRTVGAVFDEALQRYYERKALREAGGK